MNQQPIRASALLLSLLTVHTLNANDALRPTELIQTSQSSSVTLKSGEASGKLTAGGQSIEMKFAYARKVKGRIDESKEEFEILLTDKPVRGELLWKGDDFSDALFYEGGKGLRLRASLEGRLIYLFLSTLIERPAQRISFGLGEDLWGEVVKIAANHIEGKSQREGETMGER